MKTSGQLRNQAMEKVFPQVRLRVMGQVKDQVVDEVWNRIGNRVMAQVMRVKNENK
jgi:hypothetical protein